MRRVLLLLTVSAGAACASLPGPFGSGPGAGQGLARAVTIARDQWGVPHIHGDTDASAAFGIAYAMAEDNYWQIEEDYLEDLGRSAHWYGERALGADLVRAAFQVERLARAEYDREPVERRRLWDAFAAGLNYYLETHPGTLRRVLHHYEPWMVFARYRDAHAEEVIEGHRLGDLAALAGLPVLPRGQRALPDAASRAWAVAPARSTSGRALLVASRSAPYFGRGQLYELHVRSDEGWHHAGVARLGTPIPSSGHGDHHAWTHTRAAGDGSRIIRVRFADPADPLAYHDGTGWQRATRWRDTLLVNTAAGLAAQTHDFIGTGHGPVIGRRGDTAFVAVISGIVPGGMLQQWYAMSRATSLAAFRDALAQGALPMLATAYADTAGNILFAPPPGSDREQVLNPASGLIDTGIPAGPHGARGVDVAPGRAMERLSVEDAARLPFETRVPGFQGHAASLAMEWEQVGAGNPGRAAALDPAIALLRSWDGEVSVGSAPATLYLRWRDHAARTPEGSFAAFRALESATAELRSEWGRDSVAWGDVNRLARTHTSGTELFRDDAAGLPLAAAPALAGTAFTAEGAPDAGPRRFARSGTAWVAVSALGVPVRTRAIVTFGQSADPASAHFFDQAAWFVRGALREAWFVPEDVRTRALRRYVPGAAATAAETALPAAS